MDEMLVTQIQITQQNKKFKINHALIERVLFSNPSTPIKMMNLESMTTDTGLIICFYIKMILAVWEYKTKQKQKESVIQLTWKCELSSLFGMSVDGLKNSSRTFLVSENSYK